MQRISFQSRGYTIRGYQHAACAQTPAPVIIMCHGFTGNCSEHGLFDDFGEVAARAGLNVIRIDCAGSGESDGDFAELTSLDGWIRDIKAAMDFAEADPDMDGRKIITMGISMGGAVSILASEDERVIATVGLAPVIFPTETFIKIFTEEKWEELRTGKTVHCAYAGEAFDASPYFLEAAESMSVTQVLESNEKPILLRFGTEDEVIGADTGRRVRNRKYPNTRVDIVAGEDHGCMQHEAETLEAVIKFLRDVIR